MRFLPILLLLVSCASAQAPGERVVVFYNVENLFDTIDAPDKLDDEFTPGSDKAWNTERYDAKVEVLARAIRAAAGGRAPDLIGLAEIENRAVVEDLGRAIGGDGVRYGVSHFESPDLRGIDCALLYVTGKDGFIVEGESRLRLAFPDEPLTEVQETGEFVAYTSRDILHVEGYFEGMENKLHLFVNHWPSRRGGLEVSEPRRFVAARALRQRIDSLAQAEAWPAVLAMGDFNDEPVNRSMAEVLGASPDPNAWGLVNLFGGADAAGEGTYNFRGNWNMLDQFVASPTLTAEGAAWRCTDARTFRADWLMYESERYGPTPSRTYGGPNYYGGASDHLPIVVTLRRSE